MFSWSTIEMLSVAIFPTFSYKMTGLISQIAHFDAHHLVSGVNFLAHFVNHVHVYLKSSFLRTTTCCMLVCRPQCRNMKVIYCYCSGPLVRSSYTVTKEGVTAYRPIIGLYAVTPSFVIGRTVFVDKEATSPIGL